VDLGLAGRVAVVSGASEGIGRAIALGLAGEGCHVVLLSRTSERLAAVAKEIRGRRAGVDALAIATDVRSADSVDVARMAVSERFGTVHVLVNNAGGRMRPGRQIAWSDDDWLRDIDTKLFGALRMTRAFEALLPNDGTGRIINVSGVAGSIVWDTAMTHGINNSAIDHLTRYLATDLAARRITVNSLIPGLIATEWRHAWADAAGAEQGISKDEFVKRVCQQKGILLGRWAETSEVADAALFLASDRAAYVTGTTLAVDGGLTANARVGG
jgi:3-oxoacyl-[acyl-carrier protein] reductase